MSQVFDYTQFITSEHNQKPKFMATVSLYVQAMVDLMNQLAAFPSLFDLATPPVGDQLDKIGAWVGASRQLNQEIDGTSVLTDAAFLVLIKLVIAMNAWDGTIPGAYEVWNVLFEAEGTELLIQDYDDMTMAVTFIFVTVPDTLTLAVLTNGYFNLRPDGVRIVGYFVPSVPGEPIFGFDVENSTIAGFDVGNWAVEI